MMKARRLQIIAGLTLGLLLGLGVLVYRNYREIVEVNPTSWVMEVKADCGVVLTGGAGRIREGLDLLQRKSIGKLIISGVNPKVQLREIFPQWPFYPGLDERDIILERRSTTTYGNVHQTLPLAEALRCRSLAVITSTTHMYRAMRTFRGAAPSTLQLRPFAVAAGFQEEGEGLQEAFKSVFYSLWAYD